MNNKYPKWSIPKTKNNKNPWQLLLEVIITLTLLNFGYIDKNKQLSDKKKMCDCQERFLLTANDNVNTRDTTSQKWEMSI